MARPPHIRLTYSGTLGTNTPAPETWSFGINATGPIDLGWLARPRADYATLAAAVRPAWGIHFQAKTQASAKLTRVRAASITGDGTTRLDGDGAYLHGDDNTVVAGTASANALPFQTSLVVSLRTARSGPTGKGRFYTPMPDVAAMPTDGLISEAQRDAFATAAAAFITAVNTALNTWSAGCAVAVMSGGSVLYATPGAASVVTQVGVGRALDTMRSRRRSLTESNEYVAV